MAQVQDSYTKNGAGLLAAMIEAFWHGRVKAERYELPGFPGMWGVRSDMVNGLPADGRGLWG